MRHLVECVRPRKPKTMMPPTVRGLLAREEVGGGQSSKYLSAMSIPAYKAGQM